MRARPAARALIPCASARGIVGVQGTWCRLVFAVALSVKRCLTDSVIEWWIDTRRLVVTLAVASGIAVGVAAGAACGITTAVSAVSAACLWWWVTPVLSQHITRLTCRIRHTTGPPLPTQSETRAATYTGAVVFVVNCGVNVAIAMWTTGGCSVTMALEQSAMYVVAVVPALTLCAAVRAWRTQHPATTRGDLG